MCHVYLLLFVALFVMGEGTPSLQSLPCCKRDMMTNKMTIKKAKNDHSFSMIGSDSECKVQV